ncbi:hypothetical protein YPPY102_2613, partial [Yersinia pestis PY-102]
MNWNCTATANGQWLPLQYLLTRPYP